MLRVFIIIAITFISTTFSFGQNRPTLPFALKGAIDSQFFYINTLSRSQDVDFKVIRKTNLDILRKNTMDTINNLKREISSLREASSSVLDLKTTLRDSIASLESDLSVEKEKTDNISFLGMSFSKSGYHTFAWSLIAGLGFAFLITLFAFRKSKVDTVQHKKTVDELQEELQTVKKRALEKEQLLKRQLLDEQLKRNS